MIRTTFHLDCRIASYNKLMEGSNSAEEEKRGMDSCNMWKVKDVTKKLEAGEKIICSWAVRKVNEENKV